MPSWQSRLLQLGIRLLIKRRVQGNEAELAAFARKKLADPRFAERMTPKDVCLEQVQENSIKGEWVWWKEEPAKYTIFYLHGGGYVACSPENYRPFTAELARQSGARIFALDYRLAPEHRFPAPVDDAVKAYRWLLAKGERPDNLVIGGDSAGGGLTIATLTALRDAGDPLPAAAFCFSPWTDLAGTGNSMMTNDRRDPMFYGASLPLFAKLYLADASSTDPLASPLYADLSQLPPLQIYVSDTEVLLADATRLAARAKEYGLNVELLIHHGQPHVWPIFVGLLPESTQTISQVVSFLSRQVNLRVNALPDKRPVVVTEVV